MNPSHWGLLGSMIREQYRYFDRFIEEIRSGVLSPGQIAVRCMMYVNSSKEAYERAREYNARELGVTEEKWELGDAEHCDDCVLFASMGWQPFGTFPVPGAGDTACLTNCKCEKIYRLPGTGEEY